MVGFISAIIIGTGSLLGIKYGDDVLKDTPNPFESVTETTPKSYNSDDGGSSSSNEGGSGNGAKLTGTSISAETIKNIPKYSGMSYTEINGNVPAFSESELTTKPFEKYSDKDSIGRCGVAYINVCKEIMPKEGEERGKIGNIKPTGWKQEKYEGLVLSKPPYLYNRCHLAAWCLSNENDNDKNLITGTRYMNVNGMLPFEEKVAKYVKKTDNHVMYRVTPIFYDEELLARGVLIEAYSVEDEGEGICFCVFCYNVQPGVGIDYATGSSWREKN